MSDSEPEQELIKLTKEIIYTRLSAPERTHDNNSFAMTKLDAKGLELQEIELLSSYPLLREIDLSENAITDASPLNSVTTLQFLDISQNDSLTELKLSLPELRRLNASSCSIKTLDLSGCPKLEHVILNSNQIESLDSITGHPNLKIVEARGNQIQSVDGLALPSLVRLYLADNPLRYFSGVRAPSLEILHLRGCEMGKNADPEPDEEEPEEEVLSGSEDEDAEPPSEDLVVKEGPKELPEVPPLICSLPALKYLNLRETKLAAPEELNVLVDNCPELLNLNVSGSDASDRIAVLKILPRLVRIDKEDVTEEDIEEANRVEEEEEEEED
ncbi:Leucine Rich repeats (2 copies) [Carpediemonas membranifera]|uniref:Leucine Rich repeats (2 copies) n=1 Tax=Carpediemonas membranifera TaxID=201153 RepID=A0A8J6E6V6_9EUKA|nr:Leucine Rich repeats (2 copies) [Carpediemonas membranifera]|eukprot:KAG9397552.1 Leucine Rich repeats (2 copies) [Carpediemonas membranifera]